MREQADLLERACADHEALSVPLIRGVNALPAMVKEGINCLENSRIPLHRRPGRRKGTFWPARLGERRATCGQESTPVDASSLQLETSDLGALLAARRFNADSTRPAISRGAQCPDIVRIGPDATNRIDGAKRRQEVRQRTRISVLQLIKARRHRALPYGLQLVRAPTGCNMYCYSYTPPLYPADEARVHRIRARERGTRPIASASASRAGACTLGEQPETPPRSALRALL